MKEGQEGLSKQIQYRQLVSCKGNTPKLAKSQIQAQRIKKRDSLLEKWQIRIKEKYQSKVMREIKLQAMKQYAKDLGLDQSQAHHLEKMEIEKDFVSILQLKDQNILMFEASLYSLLSKLRREIAREQRIPVLSKKEILKPENMFETKQHETFSSILADESQKQSKGLFTQFFDNRRKQKDTIREKIRNNILKELQKQQPQASNDQIYGKATSKAIEDYISQQLFKGNSEIYPIHMNLNSQLIRLFEEDILNFEKKVKQMMRRYSKQHCEPKVQDQVREE